MSENLWIKNQPPELRPVERCLKLGASALSDAELLAVIFRTGVAGKSAVMLAGELLCSPAHGKGLAAVLHMNSRELMDIPGIGAVKAAQVMCVGELTRRIAEDRSGQRIGMSSPQSVASYYMQKLRGLEREQLVAVMLDGKNRRIEERTMTVGTVNASLVSPREIFLEALRYHAVGVLLLHNHPSGDPAPSPQDILVTKRVAEAGKILGVELIDHIIIGDNSYISLKERGLFQ